jgi:hypothetical protein
MTSGMHLNIIESLGTEHKRGRGLVQGWWWPIAIKFVFEQMVEPVPEIMDGSL